MRQALVRINTSIGLFVALHLASCGTDREGISTELDSGAPDAALSTASDVTLRSNGTGDSQSTSTEQSSTLDSRSEPNTITDFDTSVPVSEANDAGESSETRATDIMPSDAGSTSEATSGPAFPDSSAPSDTGDVTFSTDAVCIPLAEPLTSLPEAARISTTGANALSPEGDPGDRPDASNPALNDADADSGSARCFPSCITELEDLCLPSSACNVFPGAGGLAACWDNGVQVGRTNASDGTAITTTSRVHVGAQACYTVEAKLYTSGGGAEWVWLNDCGETVATATKLSGQSFAVSCTDRDETATVDMSEGACSNYADGAPNLFLCDQAPGCPN